MSNHLETATKSILFVSRHARIDNLRDSRTAHLTRSPTSGACKHRHLILNLVEFSCVFFFFFFKLTTAGSLYSSVGRGPDSWWTGCEPLQVGGAGESLCIVSPSLFPSLSLSLSLFMYRITLSLPLPFSLCVPLYVSYHPLSSPPFLSLCPSLCIVSRVNILW